MVNTDYVFMCLGLNHVENEMKVSQNGAASTPGFGASSEGSSSRK